jgi:hypothetical protein
MSVTALETPPGTITASILTIGARWCEEVTAKVRAAR